MAWTSVEGEGFVIRMNGGRRPGALCAYTHETEEMAECRKETNEIKEEGTNSEAGRKRKQHTHAHTQNTLVRSHLIFHSFNLLA